MILVVEFKNISPKFTDVFFEIVEKSSNIIITGHEFFDDDSLASALSVYEIISQKYQGKNTRILFSGEPDSRYKDFKHFNHVEFVSDIADFVDNAELLIMLDGNKFSRFSHKPEILGKIKKTICIDHHASQSDTFSLSLMVHQCSSCVEIVYRSFFTDYLIDKSLADIFLLGILGDTGNFTYLKPSQSDILLIVKKLIDISQEEIQGFLSKYQSISKKVFETVKELIKNNEYVSTPGWPDFQYSYIKRSFIKANKLQTSEIVEASYLYSAQYIRKIENYSWGFVFTPNQNGDVNISCRSLPGSVNVRILMEKMGIGGGHDRASGGTFAKKDKPLEVDSCIKQTLDWLRSNPSHKISNIIL